MAKDDYNVIVFKILTYLYGCFQRKYLFNKAEFLKLLESQHIAEQYLSDVLRIMQEEGLIAGLIFKKAWGNEYLLINDYRDMTITALGIRFLLEDKTMGKVKEFFTGVAQELTASLIAVVFQTAVNS